MQKIVRTYTVITAIILCLTLLATGIISVNEETSYVLSGEKEEVVRVQSTTSERLLVSQTDEHDENMFEIMLPDKETVIMILSGILPSPFSQIVWSMM